MESTPSTSPTARTRRRLVGPRATRAVKDVIRVVDDVGEGGAYGADIIKETGMFSGTVYPVLRRLVEHGLVTETWEPPPTNGGSKRRLFTITPDGTAYRTQHAPRNGER